MNSLHILPDLCSFYVRQICARTLCSHTRPTRKKAKSERKQAFRFVDVKRIRVTGGNGGDGCMSFLSLPRKEWAGPDGGDGGHGGHVIFQACGIIRSLVGLRSLHRGVHGVRGSGNHCHGKNAPHTILKVPLGTRFRDENGELLADLKTEGDMFIGARGGAGGKGNHFFLTNETRAPTVYENGGQGEEQLLYAELRIMAHAGLVGFPNVGKSSLLRAISRAKPKVAAYPFTTLHPHVGMIQYPDNEQIAVADLPGLVVGAHLNYGLGFSFLRHIERCQWLMYVLDASLPEPWTQMEALQHELDCFQPGLSQRPHAVIANKMDIDGAQDNLDQLQKRLTIPVFGLSALTGTNIKPLLEHLKELFDKHNHEDTR